MPYSKKSELPERIKKMSSKKQEAWMKAFNNAYKQKKNEDASDEKAESYAYATANSVINEMKESNRSMSGFSEKRQLKRIAEDNVGNLNHVYESSLLSKDRVKITEADSEDPKAIITVIESGVSNNRFQYSHNIIEELRNFIDNGRKKLYVNHQEDNKKFGRNLKEWGATFLKTWTEKENGKTQIKAEIDFKGAPEGVWLLEAMKHHPEEIGFSIDAYAKVQEAEGQDGKPVMEVVEWQGYNSTDFVGNPSAGGKTDRVLASTIMNDFDIIKVLEKTLSDRFTKEMSQRKVFTLLDLFMGMLHESLYAINRDETQDKEAYIQELVDDFLKEFNQIDIVQAFESVQEETNIKEIDVRDKARTPEFEGTEDIEFPSESVTWSAYRDGYYKHEGDKPDNDEDIPEDVTEASSAMKTWIAKKSLLGKATAEDFESLLYFPVVNPNTNKLNRNALENAWVLAGNADIEEYQMDTLRDEIQTLTIEQFDFDISESTMNKEETMEIKSLKELKTQAPEIFEAAVTEAVEDYKKTQEKNSEMDELKEEVASLKESMDNQKKELEETEEKLKEANKTIGEYELKEQEEKREIAVRKAIEDSKLPEFDKLPERVRESLLDTEEDELEQAVSDYEELLGHASDKSKNSWNLTDTKENPKVTEEEKPDVNLKDADSVKNMLATA